MEENGREKPHWYSGLKPAQLIDSKYLELIYNDSLNKFAGERAATWVLVVSLVATTSLLALDEALGLIGGGVTLVDELVIEVKEARMILKVVLLAVEESIELGKVRSIFGFTIGLRAVVGVTVNITEILLGVVHVLGVIDLVVLSLAISDLPSVAGTDVGILAEVRADEGTVRAAVVLAHHHLGGTSKADEAKNFPATGHTFEVLHLAESKGADEGASEPSEVSDTTSTGPESFKLSPVLLAHVVGEKIAHISLAVLVEVVVLETVILNLHLSEPGSARDLAHAAKVAHWRKLIQHLLCY